jgi:hypothetical protein
MKLLARPGLPKITRSFAKKNALCQKEHLLDQIEQAGFEPTIQPYFSASHGQTAKDTALSMAVLEVAIQLVGNAWNQREHGQM